MKNSSMKLNELTKEFDIYPPAMVEARRLSRQHRALNESRKPFTGVYYWVPRKKSRAEPEPGWKLMVFDEEYYGETTHLEVWSKYVAKQLGLKSREVSNAYMGLPRGRVVSDLNDPRRFILFHGGDTPPPKKKGLGMVLSAFNLSPMITKVEQDKHEQRDARDTKIVKDALKYQQRLSSVPVGSSPRDIDLGSDYDDGERYSDYSHGDDLNDDDSILDDF